VTRASGPALRWVALGDSYTIGTAVEPGDRWPERVAARLRDRGVAIDLVANLAVNGYTSRDVVERELPALDALLPGFVSLLVGVNDVVQGVPLADYGARLEAILADLLGRLPADRLLLVTTPDYTVTPAGADYGDPLARSAAIREANAVLAGIAGRHDVAVVDVHDLSLAAATDRTLVAADGLHPSATQYARWVDRIAPVVERLLGLTPG
jgi:lysophospholipase L1-like esterase